jgi:phasin family protein
MANVKTVNTVSPEVAANLEKFRVAGESAFEAAAASGKATLEGVITVDEALLGYTRVAFDDTVAHWREALKAKNVADLVEQQKRFVEGRYETVSNQGRELVELTREQIEKSLSPLREFAPGEAKAA